MLSLNHFIPKLSAGLASEAIQEIKNEARCRCKITTLHLLMIWEHPLHCLIWIQRNEIGTIGGYKWLQEDNFRICQQWLLFYSFNCKSVNNLVTIKLKKQESLLPISYIKTGITLVLEGIRKAVDTKEIYPVAGFYPPENWSIPF